MYLRKYDPYKDKTQLVNLAVTAFGVDPKLVTKILRRSDNILVLSLKNGYIVGFLCYNLFMQNIAFINYAVIHSDYQGKGIAHSMLPTLISYAKEQNIKAIMGFVSNRNPEAFNIFTRWGIQPIFNLSDGVIIGKFIE